MEMVSRLISYKKNKIKGFRQQYLMKKTRYLFGFYYFELLYTGLKASA